MKYYKNKKHQYTFDQDYNPYLVGIDGDRAYFIYLNGMKEHATGYIDYFKEFIENGQWVETTIESANFFIDMERCAAVMVDDCEVTFPSCYNGLVSISTDDYEFTVGQQDEVVKCADGYIISIGEERYELTPLWKKNS